MTSLDKWYNATLAALQGLKNKTDDYQFAVSLDGQSEVVRFDNGQTAIRSGDEWRKVKPDYQLAAVILEGLSQ